MMTVMSAMDAFERSVEKKFEPRILEQEYHMPGLDPVTEAEEASWLGVKNGMLSLVPSARHDPALFLNVLTNILDRLMVHGGIFQMAALMIFIGKEVDAQFPAIKPPATLTRLQSLFQRFSFQPAPEPEDTAVVAEREALACVRERLREPLCELWLGALLIGQQADEEVGTSYTRQMLDSMPGAELQSDLLLSGTVTYWRKACNLL